MTWLTLLASIDTLPQFTEFLREGARLASIPESEFGKLDLVWEEVLVNVARYAYPADEPGRTEVGYIVPEPGHLLVQFRDTGRPYNPLDRDLPDLTADLADRKPGGLGIFLIKTFADSISYDYSDGRNVLSITVSAGRAV